MCHFYEDLLVGIAPSRTFCEGGVTTGALKCTDCGFKVVRHRRNSPISAAAARLLRRRVPFRSSMAFKMHSKGIVHMDIKPSNVFVDHVGNWLLGDFDASCHVGEPIYATTRGFHVTTTQLWEQSTIGVPARFRHDWEMLLCTAAVLMTVTAGTSIHAAGRINVHQEASVGLNFGHMVQTVRDEVLATAEGALADWIVSTRHFEGADV